MPPRTKFGAVAEFPSDFSTECLYQCLCRATLARKAARMAVSETFARLKSFELIFESGSCSKRYYQVAAPTSSLTYQGH